MANTTIIDYRQLSKGTTQGLCEWCYSARAVGSTLRLTFLAESEGQMKPMFGGQSRNRETSQDCAGSKLPFDITMLRLSSNIIAKR